MPKSRVPAAPAGRMVVTPRSVLHIALYSFPERGVVASCRCGGFESEPLRYEAAREAFEAHKTAQAAGS